jgi:hypothetical protein
MPLFAASQTLLVVFLEHRIELVCRAIKDHGRASRAGAEKVDVPAADVNALMGLGEGVSGGEWGGGMRQQRQDNRKCANEFLI